MTPPASPNRSQPPRFPGESMSHAVWRYCRGPRSPRDIAARRCAREMSVSYAARRPWGHASAPTLRRRRARPGEQGPRDAVCLTLHQARHALWRAVEHAGVGRDRRVPRRRPTPAAQQCFRKRRTGCQAVPRGLRTEKRTSSGAAQRARRPGGEHRQQRSRTPRAAHAPPPTRQRDQRRQRCKAPGHAPRVLSASGPMAHHCRPRRHRLAAPAYRQARRHRGHVGGESTGTAAAASEWSRSETGPIAPLCCLWTISAPKKLSTPSSAIPGVFPSSTI
jgi:putative transposase